MRCKPNAGSSLWDLRARSKGTHIELLPKELVVICHPAVDLLFQLINRQRWVFTVSAGGAGEQWHALWLCNDTHALEVPTQPLLVLSTHPCPGGHRDLTQPGLSTFRATLHPHYPIFS